MEDPIIFLMPGVHSISNSASTGSKLPIQDSRAMLEGKRKASADQPREPRPQIDDGRERTRRSRGDGEHAGDRTDRLSDRIRQRSDARRVAEQSDATGRRRIGRDVGQRNRKVRGSEPRTNLANRTVEGRRKANDVVPPPPPRVSFVPLIQPTAANAGLNFTRPASSGIELTDYVHTLTMQHAVRTFDVVA